MDSPKDDLVIDVNDIDEDEEDKSQATTNNEIGTLQFLNPHLPSLPKFRSLPTSSLPTELKDLSSKPNELTREELPKEFLSLPVQVASVQAKLKTLDALPGLLSHVTKSLNKFAQVLDSTSSKARDQSVPSAGQANTTPAKKPNKFDFVTESGEHVHLTKEHINAQKKIVEEAKAKAARCESEIKKEELIDLLGLDKSKFKNHPDILTRKGPITLKVYREDDTSEIIPKFKASDLYLGERREVVTVFPNKKGKGWTSIYKQIHKRIDYLCTNKVELGIDLDRPLSEQDPLDRLNDQENKKRKHADEIHDFLELIKGSSHQFNIKII
nr:hypothetical protein [Tanacetum cinerariifolium]